MEGASLAAHKKRFCLSANYKSLFENQYFEHGSEKKGAVYDRIAILVIGGWLYSKLSVKLLQPSAAPTPAYTRQEGLDFVPMGKARNSLINLLNIAGTGPVLGPIQGILFGPIAFLTIPIGCVLGGAIHDYWCGMISLRNGATQMPALVEKFLGKAISKVYFVFLVLVLMLVGVVFVYTPGDLFVGQVLGITADAPNYLMVTIITLAVIFGYYILATMLPIDKIIGKIYPIFGVILFLSSAAVFAITCIGVFSGKYVLNEIWDTLPDWAYTGALNPTDPHYVPTFCVTVACGIVSGFHSSQVTLISRTAQKEKDGSMIFFGMMCVEGFIAMSWAAGAMIVFNLGMNGSPTDVVGLISKEMLHFLWVVPVASVIILPISSGDTAFRSVRLLVQDFFKMKKSTGNNLMVALGIFAAGIALLVWAKASPNGFSMLWRYFGFANQAIAVFTFGVISVYMMRKDNPFLMALIPGTFYAFIVSSFILHQEIGFRIANWNLCYAIAGVLATAFAIAVYLVGKRQRTSMGLLKDCPEELGQTVSEQTESASEVQGGNPNLA